MLLKFTPKTVGEVINALFDASDSRTLPNMVANLVADGIDIGAICRFRLESHEQNEMCFISGMPRNPRCCLSEREVAVLETALGLAGVQRASSTAIIAGYQQRVDDQAATSSEWLPQFVARNVQLAANQDISADDWVKELLKPVNDAVDRLRERRRQSAC